MRRFLFLLFCMLSVNMYSRHFTAVVNEPGQLERVVMNSGIGIYDITSLKVIGSIDSDDIVFLCFLGGRMSSDHETTYSSSLNGYPKTKGKLEVLDLSESTIVYSDKYYYDYSSYNGSYLGTEYYRNRTEDSTIDMDMFGDCKSIKIIKWPNSAKVFRAQMSIYDSRHISIYGPNINQYVGNNVRNMSIIGNEVYWLGNSIPSYGFSYSQKIHVLQGLGDSFQQKFRNIIFLEGVLIQKFADWQSTNHEDNTTSSRTTKVHIPAGSTLSFDYSVSSEEDCDYLTVSVNGKKLINKSGEVTNTYSGTFENEVIGELSIKYSKDEMSAGGTDGAYIKNMTLTLPENGYYGNDYVKLGCDNLNFYDEEHFDMVVDFVAPQLTYKRKFNNTDWQALYVPFSIEYDNWKDDFEIARLNDIHQYDDNDDGEIDRMALEIVKIKSGRTQANTPYVIRAKSVGDKEIVMKNAKVSPTDGDGCVVSSWNTHFYITGCYAPIPGTTMVANGYYALGGGSLHKAASETNNLGSNRWYIEAIDRNGNQINFNEIKICVFGEDDMWETSIEDMSGNEPESQQRIYDLSGRKVGNAKKGIYIKNGKKYVVK